MKGIVIRPGGTPEVVDADWSLERLQVQIGGDIEAFPAPAGDLSVYGDEEGKLKGLPRNEIVDLWLKPLLMPGDTIVGTVVILGFDDTTGDELDVPQRIVQELVGP